MVAEKNCSLGTLRTGESKKGCWRRVTDQRVGWLETRADGKGTKTRWTTIRGLALYYMIQVVGLLRLIRFGLVVD